MFVVMSTFLQSLARKTESLCLTDLFLGIIRKQQPAITTLLSRSYLQYSLQFNLLFPVSYQTGHSFGHNTFPTGQRCSQNPTEYMRHYMRRYRQKIRQNPARFQLYKERQRMHDKRSREKRKLLNENQ